MGARDRYKRSGLFLVRMWTEEAEDGTGQVECRGKVQRVVDGESHQFNDGPDLLKLLVAMLAKRKGETGGNLIQE